MNKNAAYWLDLCDYDLDTAKALISTGRFLYVGFMCHLVIEKALKACFCEFISQTPAKTHNLARLADSAGLYSRMNDKQLDLLDTLMPLNIEARYPVKKSELMKALTFNECKRIITETEALYQWIKGQLNKV